MEREWEIGDRFTLEFEVTGWSGEWTECKTIGATRRAFPPSDMQHAKLIEPAEEEKAEELDLSKPLKVIRSGDQVTYLCASSNGEIAVEDHRGFIMVYRAEALENIPEPKITTSDILSLWEFKSGERLFLWGEAAGCATRISKARVSYTEGKGWSIEEIK